MATPRHPGVGYTHRIAFGAWINDMRNDPLPLENWPAPQLDDETIRSVIKALDLQSRMGYNYLDAWGFFATAAWPLDIGKGVSPERKRAVQRILREAHARGIGVIYGMGTYSWGYEAIIKDDPSVGGRSGDGTPMVDALCDANPKSFEWVQRILDFVLSEFDFDGVHLESFDRGGCFCPNCAGGDEGLVGYHSRINAKTADYIRSRWPDKLINVIPIGWNGGGKNCFDEAQKAHLLELGQHVDGFYDQGWKGTYIADAERREFIEKLPCTYGTSGGLWPYPSVRWDRTSYFLPCTKRQGRALQDQFRDGVRGCMHYQGPLANPGTELNIAFGGRLLTNPDRSVETVLREVVEELYQPRSAQAGDKLAELVVQAEDAYFGQWEAERFDKNWGTNMPGEFYLDRLFGTSPGPAGFIVYDQYMGAEGRAAYKQGLLSVVRDLEPIRAEFRDDGRVEGIRRSVLTTLLLLNTIGACKGEDAVWND